MEPPPEPQALCARILARLAVEDFLAWLDSEDKRLRKPYQPTLPEVAEILAAIREPK